MQLANASTEIRLIIRRLQTVSILGCAAQASQTEIGASQRRGQYRTPDFGNLPRNSGLMPY